MANLSSREKLEDLVENLEDLVETLTDIADRLHDMKETLEGLAYTERTGTLLSIVNDACDETGDVIKAIMPELERETEIERVEELYSMNLEYERSVI